MADDTPGRISSHAGLNPGPNLERRPVLSRDVLDQLAVMQVEDLVSPVVLTARHPYSSWAHLVIQHSFDFDTGADRIGMSPIRPAKDDFPDTSLRVELDISTPGTYRAVVAFYGVDFSMRLRLHEWAQQPREWTSEVHVKDGGGTAEVDWTSEVARKLTLTCTAQTTAQIGSAAYLTSVTISTA